MAHAIARLHWTWRASADIYTREFERETHPDSAHSTQSRLLDIFDRNTYPLGSTGRPERRFSRQWRNAAALLARREKVI